MSDNNCIEMIDAMSTSFEADSDAEPAVPGNSFPATRLAPNPEVGQPFKPFNRFPKEIRELIWGFAAGEPQVIKVHQGPNETIYGGGKHLYTYLEGRRLDNVWQERGGPGWTPTFKLQSIAPAIMHTCRESRTVGQRFYERIPPPRASLYGDTYANWKCDIFILAPGAVSLYVMGGYDDPHRIREKIVRLGLADRMVGDKFVDYQKLDVWGKRCPKGSEEIVLIQYELPPNQGSSLTLVEMEETCAEMNDWQERLQGIAKLSK